MNTPLKISNLTKTFADYKAVNDVSFELNSGEIFGLLGPNGAGKTTLISCVVSLEKPDAGKIEVNGFDIASNPKLAKTSLGYVPQEVINHGYFTVKEILQFYSGYFGILKNNERIDYLLQRLALYEHKDKKVKQLSGGMKRRLMIAKSLVHHPKVLLLDEPTAGVDIELRNSLWSFVQELKNEGTTVLLTTHYLEEAEELCDRIGVIHRGRLLQIGKTSELISDLTFRRFDLEVQNPPKVSAESSKYIKYIEGNKISLEFSSRLTVGEVIKESGIDLSNVVDLQLKEGSLEEAFIRILNEKNENKKEGEEHVYKG